MDRYTSSMDTRMKLAELLEQGISELEAIKIALQGDSNAARKINTWKAHGVYPFGPVSAPGDQLLMDIPAAAKPVAAPVRPSRDDLTDMIRQVVKAELAQHTPTIEVVRPKLKRSKATTTMKSFRCPEALWDLADKKAQTLNMSLNGVVESLLFQWLGSPEELLKD